jgi:ATP-dependent Clp protease ATP-binding subunit ClpB
MAELRRHFRPEFLNRVDDIVMFKPLTREEIKAIIDLQVLDLRKRLADRHITLELTESAREFIAREAYDPVYGARPLKRYLQHEVETRLGRALIGGEIRDGAAITVDAQSDSLTVEAKNPAEVDAFARKQKE